MSQDDHQLGDLTKQMAGWRTASPIELHLDDGQMDAFLRNVESINAELKAQLDGASGLHDWLGGANVGTFASATTTRSDLQQDVMEFITAVQQFHQYLQTVNATTDAARHNIQALDSHG